MQTLVELLIELKKIANEPDDANKLERINAMFSNPRAPAELQVGRHYVSRLLVKNVDVHLGSLDPEERLLAVTTARLIFPRTTAARVLRRVVKDPDHHVRSAARGAVSSLGLSDVAPPDIRYKESKASPIGGYNPTGWAFGIFPHDKSPQRKVKKPSRVKALEQHQLPKLADRAAVAAFAGVDEDGLVAMMRPGVEAGSGYVEFEIPKMKGGTRRIAAPRTPLRKIQRKILDEILAKVPVHDACHGFVQGRSTVTNAKPHERAAIVIKLDLRDSFRACTTGA